MRLIDARTDRHYIYEFNSQNAESSNRKKDTTMTYKKSVTHTITLQNAVNNKNIITHYIQQ